MVQMKLEVHLLENFLLSGWLDILFYWMRTALLCEVICFTQSSHISMLMSFKTPSTLMHKMNHHNHLGCKVNFFFLLTSKLRNKSLLFNANLKGKEGTFNNIAKKTGCHVEFLPFILKMQSRSYAGENSHQRRQSSYGVNQFPENYECESSQSFTEYFIQGDNFSLPQSK